MRPETINHDITLYQNEGSLAYGTDAYLLSAYIRRQTREKALEFGTGSGVISLLLAKRGATGHITGLEIQEKIAKIAEKNVELNSLSDKISILHHDVREPLPSLEGAFGIVFTNPPYMTVTSGGLNQNEADCMSRHEVNGTIRDFCASASRFLKFGGLFYAVYRPDRTAELLFAAKSAGLEPKRMTFVHPTASHAPCLVLLEAKKGSAEGMKVTKPLIIYKDGPQTVENYTDDMNHIYQNGAFHELYQRL